MQYITTLKMWKDGGLLYNFSIQIVNVPLCITSLLEFGIVSGCASLIVQSGFANIKLPVDLVQPIRVVEQGNYLVIVHTIT